MLPCQASVLFFPGCTFPVIHAPFAITLASVSDLKVLQHTYSKTYTHMHIHTRPCRHLFPFEMRRRYFYSTAFGLNRALQHMHALHAAELGGSGGAGNVITSKHSLH